MNTLNDNYSVTVPATEIIDLESFEELRQRAYQNKDNASTLTQLATATLSSDGKCLYDKFEEIIDTNEASTEIANKLGTIATGTQFYELVLGNDAEIHQIYRGTSLPEDKEAIATLRHAAHYIPSGPNHNTFRVR